jgi:probable HAF family extracellular repeat protein
MFWLDPILTLLTARRLRDTHTRWFAPIRGIPRTALGIVALGTLLACEEPTQPAASATAAAPLAPPELAGGFTSRSLGTLGGLFSASFGINERTEVVGDATLPSEEVRAFLWRQGRGMRDLGTLGGPGSFGNAVNDQSDVVGFSRIAPGPEVFHAFLWDRANGMRDLGTLGGVNSAAASINNRREVVGVSDNANGRPRAFLWRPGRRMRSLGTLGGTRSEATDINDATQVVGWSDIAPGGPRHAFLWTAERGMEDLGTLGGSSFATGISETGEVVGESVTAAGRREAFLWTRAGGMRSLGTLGGEFSDAAAVNTHRRIVGTSASARGRQLAFFWTPELGMRRLPPMGENNSASDINEFGAVAGSGVPEADFRAVLWTPIEGPLVMRPSEEMTTTEAATVQAGSGEGLLSPCASRKRFGEHSSFLSVVGRGCLKH